MLLPRKNPNPPLTFFVNGDLLYKYLPAAGNDILLIGDSQFAFYPAVELTGMMNVKNRGIYYDSTRGILKRVADMVNGKPEKIFILGGINDLEQEVPIDIAAKNMDKSLSIIRQKSPGTKIYVLSILPTSLKFGENPHSVESERQNLNKMYSNIAAKYGATYINLDASFKGDGLKPAYNIGDNIHLSAAGYIKLTEILMPYLKE